MKFHTYELNMPFNKNSNYIKEDSSFYIMKSTNDEGVGILWPIINFEKIGQILKRWVHK